MRLAAQRTLEAGYTHFRLDQASSSQGSRLVGVNTSGQATNFGNGFVVGSATSTPVYPPCECRRDGHHAEEGRRWNR
jgi:hypothetical protein